jgi:putative Mg2+ transporter-C (MgtC) family protein
MTGLINKLEWYLYLSHLVELAVAFVLALPIGWDREKSARSAGLRTFPLVAVASCGFVLIGIDVAGDRPDALARVLYGLMTGIGFIGGGAIIKDGSSVRGTATAASIWNTGAVGAAVAFERYEIAIALSLFNFLILRIVRPFKGSARAD